MVGYDGDRNVKDGERSVGKKKLSRKPEPKRRIAWPRWTGFGNKTVWDWLQLLIVPLMLATLGFWFTAQQEARQQQLENQRAKAERELAEQRAQDEALQAYLNQMTSLLLEENLRESEKGSELRILAQARTATVIQTLDVDGNRNVIRFLKETRLTGNIYGETPSAISLLRGTDLQGARLAGLDLSNVDLTRTILDDAHPRGGSPGMVVECLPSQSRHEPYLSGKLQLGRSRLGQCHSSGCLPG